MKTIKNIKQLQAEKKRISKHRQELELKLQHNWNEFKQSVAPSAFATATFDAVIKNRAEKNNNTVLKSVVSLGATLLANKLVNKAGEKLRHILHKKQTA